jgi:hypothetical protein
MNIANTMITTRAEVIEEKLPELFFFVVFWLVVFTGRGVTEVALTVVDFEVFEVVWLLAKPFLVIFVLVLFVELVVFVRLTPFSVLLLCLN